MYSICVVNLRTLDLNLLKVLDALLSEGSTVRAGERLGLSQPAVSAALGRLRHALGDPLFVRRGTGLEPTDVARAMKVPLAEALEALVRVLSTTDRFDPMRETRAFRISGTDLYSELMMPALADRLSREAPGVRVHMVNLIADNYLSMLDTFGVDIAIVPQVAPPDFVETAPVHRSDFIMVARKGHARLARARVRPGEIVPLDLFCDLGHVLMSPDGQSRGQTDAALEHVGRERRVVMTMPAFGGVYQAVADSDLVALLPHQLAEHVAGRAGLEMYLPPVPIAPAQLILAWPKRSASDPAHRWLRGIVSELLAELNRPPVLAVSG